MRNSKCLCSKCTVTNCDRKEVSKRRAIGKRNRNTGRYAEKKLFALFNDWNIPIDKTFASGSKKELAEEFGDKFSGDFNIQGLIDQNIKIENKKKQYKAFKRYYELVKFGIVHIKGFCYLIPQAMFQDVILHQVRHSVIEIEEKQFKVLRSFFEQDNAEIVSMISPSPDSNRYLDFIFAVREDIYEKLLKRQERNK